MQRPSLLFWGGNAATLYTELHGDQRNSEQFSGLALVGTGAFELFEKVIEELELGRSGIRTYVYLLVISSYSRVPRPIFSACSRQVRHSDSGRELLK